ncbi:MAG TPA: type II secretion system protein [Holophagaceae bacterium]|nr:type II secretion system protein [Holophagaceae bacterium]
MRARSRQSGYTLIELLVVMAIIGALSIAAASYLTLPRQKPAVQNLLSETEGLLGEASKYSGAALANVVLETNGTWTPTTTFRLSFRQVGAATPDVNAITSQAFPDRLYAGYDTSNAGVALAVGSETLAAALAATPGLSAELGPALNRNLVAPGGGGIQLNAFNKQYLAPFCIPIVGLRNGEPYAGAPAGYIVVTGSSIYKFYKSGPGAQNPWRRL